MRKMLSVAFQSFFPFLPDFFDVKVSHKVRSPLTWPIYVAPQLKMEKIKL